MNGEDLQQAGISNTFISTQPNSAQEPQKAQPERCAPVRSCASRQRCEGARAAPGADTARLPPLSPEQRPGAAVLLRLAPHPRRDPLPAASCPVPSRPPPLTLPAVGERGAAGRRGPAQAGHLGVEDEEPEGEHACSPAPRHTWHGAGGQLRAGRLSGPRHGRAAPGAAGHRRRSAQGLRGAVPVSGFCRRRKEGCGEGAAPGSPRLGAAGVNAAGRTEPGRAGGEGEEARPPTGTAAPLRPHRGRSGAFGPAALWEGCPHKAASPRWVTPVVSAEGPGQGASQPRTGPGRGSPGAGEGVRGTREFVPLSTAL